MKLLKNKRGFTLVELLAVIVVLAILMLIATNNVLPMIEKAKKGAFVTTANQFVDSAMNMQMYNNLSTTSAASNSLCTTPDSLISGGYVDKVSSGTYTGTVYIGRKDDGTYLKYICIKDIKNNYNICKDVSNVNVIADDVKAGDPTATPMGTVIGDYKVDFASVSTCTAK
jgi:prepilin-type N-terminal cleavage/methylation domain-containing protein